jgi:hypothetical protein
MPFEIFNKFRLVVSDYNARDRIWGDLSRSYIDEFDKNKVVDASEIDTRLKWVFRYLAQLFEQKLKIYNEAAFFMFVHVNNESTTELLFEQINGYVINHPTIRADDLAVDRRVYKIILEQFTKIDLFSSGFIDALILDNVEKYEKWLGELLYIGSYIYFMKDLIAQNKFYEHSIVLTINGEGYFSFTLTQPFNSVIDCLTEQFKEDSNYKVGLDYSPNLFDLLSDIYGIDVYEVLSVLLDGGIEHEFSFIKLHRALKYLDGLYGYRPREVFEFLSGLILGRHNALSIEDTYLRSQHIDRYFYRPILKVKVNGETLFKIGPFKLRESITSLGYNAIPYGHLPKEWLRFKKVKKLMGGIQNNHDAVLENPVEKELIIRGIPYDRNIKSFTTDNSSQNINFEKDTGEIDLLFVLRRDEGWVLYVCECKNNRFRDDFYNWQRDY